MPAGTSVISMPITFAVGAPRLHLGQEPGCRKPGWSQAPRRGATASDGSDRLARHDAASGRRRHEWVPGQKWDLIVTMDDATGEHYSMFFIDEEGTQSSFRASGMLSWLGVVWLPLHGPGSHCWHTPEAGGKVDRTHPTSSDGRCGARNHDDRPIPGGPGEEASGRFAPTRTGFPRSWPSTASIPWREATRYLRKVYRPAFNEEFMHRPWKRGRASSSGSATTSKTSSASSMTGSSATTTPSPSKGSSSRSRPTGTGATTSRPMCGCIATSIRAWPSSTAQEDWRTTRRTGS